MPRFASACGTLPASRLNFRIDPFSNYTRIFNYNLERKMPLTCHALRIMVLCTQGMEKRGLLHFFVFLLAQEKTVFTIDILFRA